MNKELTTYRKVDSLFDGLFKSCDKIEALKGYPKAHLEEDYVEDRIIMATTNDGTEIEICNWHEADMHLIDVSVDKEAYDRNHEYPFEKYATEMGIFTENVEHDGMQYIYSNQGEKNGTYRMQYYIVFTD